GEAGGIWGEVGETGDVDRNAARRDSARRGIDLRLDRAGVLGSPRPGSAEFDRIAPRLATEQNPCRHCATPSLKQRRTPTLDPRQAASRNRTGCVTAGPPPPAASPTATRRGRRN